MSSQCPILLVSHSRFACLKAPTREEAARWVEVLKVLQTMEEEESKVGTRASDVSWERLHGAPITECGLGFETAK